MSLLAYRSGISRCTRPTFPSLPELPSIFRAEVISTRMVSCPVPAERWTSWVRRLRAHPEEAQRMGAAARRRVLDHFTWDRVVDRCLEAYSGSPQAAPAEYSAVS